MIRPAQAYAARKRYQQIAPVLNEQSRRRFVALEVRALGRGGVSFMARMAGLARSTIYRGVSDLRNNVTTLPGRIRKEGGGRKKKILCSAHVSWRLELHDRAALPTHQVTFLFMDASLVDSIYLELLYCRV
jgi:hypothetical protein